MDAQEVLDFWFLPSSDPGHGQQRAEWFRKDDAFDAVIRERFGAAINHAIAGGLREWDEEGPRGVLAGIWVLDQFTRNAYRGTPESFAGDVLALNAARQLVASGAHLALSPWERSFAYMPFEHAEDARTQEQSVALFTDLAASHEGFSLDARRTRLPGQAGCGFLTWPRPSTWSAPAMSARCWDACCRPAARTWCRTC